MSSDTTETDHDPRRIDYIKETAAAILKRSEANEETPNIASDEVVDEVASAANVSSTQAQAVIEQIDPEDLSKEDDDAEPKATEDPRSLRKYAADLIAPASLRIAPTDAQTSDIFAKVLYIEGYPEYARPKMFERLFADADHVNVDVSIHIKDHDRLNAIGRLKSAIEDLQVRVAQKSETSDVTLRDTTRRLEAHEDVYDLLSTGQDEAFDVGVYVILRGDDPDRLEEAANDIETKLKTRRLTVKPADYRQQEGLVSGSPLDLDRVNRTKTMLGGAVGTMFPFSTTSLIEEEGVLMGYHALTDAPIVMDRFSRSSYNAIVAGTLGAGKSFNTKLNLLRRVARDPGTIVIIIDPRGGFDHLVDALDGDRIPVDGSCSINPLEIEAIPDHVRAEMDGDYDPFQQARSSALDMFDSYFAMNASSGGDSSYTTERRAILAFALDLTYALYGITNDPATHSNQSPTIPDVRSILGAISRNPEPYIHLSNTGMQITPDVVDDLPGLDVERHRVTATSAPEQASVTELPDITKEEADRLKEADITTLGDIAETDPNTVAHAADVPPSDAATWCDQAVTPAAFLSSDAPDAAATDGGVESSSTDAAAFEIPDEEVKNWQGHATGLKIALQPFRPGGPLGHLGQPTEIDISGSNVVYLDLEANDTDSQTSLMTKVLFNTIYERAKTTDKRVILPIDEAWRLIKNSESLTWLEQGTRFSRHHDLSIQFITQTLDEFYEREDAKAIIDNCTIKFLHRLKEVTAEQAESLDLTQREVNYITNATAGQTHAGYSQALLSVEDEGKFPLRVEALPEEVPVIDPDAAANLDMTHNRQS